MKELSMEEKAKRYKEAIKEASIAYKDEDRHLKATLERIFPELKESRGERIRKELIAFLEENYETGRADETWSSTGIKRWLDWLKKQGEKNPAEWHIEDEQNLNACLGYIPDELLRRWLKDVIYVKYDKPINMVEPKFNVGDWIVACYGSVNQVISVDEDVLGYTLDDGTYFSGSFSDKYHLWTIQDAKDGDVLVHSSFMFDDFIFIYNNTSNLQAYCYYSKERNRFIIEDRGHHCPWNMQEVTPATKEQRETLEKAMIKAGYKWDADKKEPIKL